MNRPDVAIRAGKCHAGHRLALSRPIIGRTLRGHPQSLIGQQTARLSIMHQNLNLFYVKQNGNDLQASEPTASARPDNMRQPVVLILAKAPGHQCLGAPLVLI